MRSGIYTKQLSFIFVLKIENIIILLDNDQTGKTPGCKNDYGYLQ